MLPSTAEIRGLYLAPAFIGRGAGTALMDRMLADARAAGATRVYVKGTLTAEPFYARCGFRTTGRTTHRTRTGPVIADFPAFLPRHTGARAWI